MIEVGAPSESWKGSKCNACGKQPHTMTVRIGYSTMATTLMFCDECRRLLRGALVQQS